MEHYALTNYITITKIFRFEMAHVLHNHRGLCKNIHGHSYHLHVTLTGEINNEPGSSDDGMLMDFGDLKAIVKDKILNQFDHALVVNSKAPFADEIQKLPFERIMAVPFQPTCENLILNFAKRLVTALPLDVRLNRLKLYETDTSYAEWHA